MGFVEDSDEHDDFNPIQDLMPPSINDDNINQIGSKRKRSDDPLRRLIEDPSIKETDISPAKRQKVTH